MPVINLQQNSQEWIEWRKSRITATDISTILGSNPWKTKIELWEEKLGLREPVKLNAAMERGQRLEPEARNLACKIIDINFVPVVIECTKYPWLGASLDGIGDGYNQYILEIKCTKEFTHLDAANGNIPEYYIDQMQTQLLVSEAEICYYFSYRPEYIDKPYIIVEIYRDIEKQAEIIKKGHEFYMQICTMQPPEEWKFIPK